MNVTVTRAYDEATPDDGIRVLVDRLWPRGVSKDVAKIDVWLKDIAPSDDLRSSWHSTEGWRDGVGFDTFRESYRAELTGKRASDEAKQALATLRDLVKSVDAVSLVTASKDPDVSHVAVLRELLT